MRLHSNGFVFHLDQVCYSEFPAREYSISGWCGTPELDSPRELWLGDAASRSPCLVGLPRPDVAYHFEQPALRDCGFVARIAVRGPEPRLDFYAAEDEDSRPILTLHRAIPFDNKDPDPNWYRDVWLPQNERRLFWTEDELSARMAALRERPLFSILLPVFNTELYHLHRCILSVMNQKYPNWELCICDDGSTDARTLEALRRFAARDSRISVIFSQRNSGISDASNRALERARGDFVVPLDHDDELHPFALLELARELNLHPEAGLIYSDEDKIDQIGFRQQPAFKPAFDEDLLLAFCYLGHLICVRRELVLRAGGFRPRFDGAQDWDLWLRVTELTGRAGVHHIAKPLYHWRLHEESTSQNLDAKPWAQRAWTDVLESCLERRGIAGAASPGLFLGSIRVKREPAPGGVAVITPLDHGDRQHVFSRVRKPNGTRLYELCLSNLYRSEEEGCAPLTTLDELPEQVVIFINGPLDSLSHGALEELAGQCAGADCGLVGGALVDRDGRVLQGCLIAMGDSGTVNASEGEHLRSLGYLGMFKVVRSVPWVSPAFFAVPKHVLREAGGLSALAAGSLDDLCWRLASFCRQKGLKILFTPYAVGVAEPPVSVSTRYPPLTRIPENLQCNPNLAAMPDPVQAMRGGL